MGSMKLRSKVEVLLLLLALAAPGLRAEVVNRIVLRVNDRIATLLDYEQRRESTLQQVTASQVSADERQRLLGELPEIVFGDLYEELLLLSRADQLKIEVTDADVDAAVTRTRESFGLQRDEDLSQALAQTGQTLDDLRAQIRKTLILREVVSREVTGKIKVDEEDLRRYYREHAEDFMQPEQLRLREIVVLDSSGLQRDDRLQVAQAIEQQIAGGAALEDAVAGFSQKGQATAVKDLGWVAVGDLDPNLTAALAGMKVGEVSKPVEARGGIHILQLVERHLRALRPFQEVQSDIEDRLRNQRYQKEYQGYVKHLEESSYIVANPPAEAADFRAKNARPPVEDPLEVLRRPAQKPPTKPAEAPPPQP